MAKRYDFVTADADKLIPIADGEYEIQGMGADFTTGQCYVQFYNGDKEPVTPTAGTVTFKASAFPSHQWLESSNLSDTINAVDVEAGNSSYTVPKFSGCIVASKMILADIAGAVYVIAFHWRE